MRNITGLARQISLPGEHVPLRFPSFPALERTATMGFNQPATLALPAATDVAVTLFRQATYPLWADQTVSHFQAVDGFFNEVITQAGPGLQDTSVSACSAYVGSTLANRLASSSSPGFAGVASTANLPYPIYGADKTVGGPGPEFLFVPASSYLGIVIYTKDAALSGGATAAVHIEQWVAPGEVLSREFTGYSVAATKRSALVSINNSLWNNCWMRVVGATFTSNAGNLPSQWAYTMFTTSQAGAPTLTDSTTTAGTVTVAPTAVVMHLPLVYPVEYANSSLPWDATRVTAAAFLGTNVSQVLNKGGTVLGGRVSPAVQNAWTVSKNYVNGLHPAEKAYLPLETGVYTYAPPSTDLVFFTNYSINVVSGVSAAPLFSLHNDSLYNKMFITASGVAETLACTTTWHVEFRTSSALFQIALCSMTLESLHAAQLVLAEAGFFFENPKHDGLLNKVISLAKKYVPPAMAAVHPVAGKVAHAVSAAITPKLGPSKPAATSGKNSGIIGEKQAKKKVGTKKVVVGKRRPK